jgi:hypothetical protein
MPDVTAGVYTTSVTVDVLLQVWCKGSGCVGTVAYGLFGSATLLWGMR